MLTNKVLVHVTLTVTKLLGGWDCFKSFCHLCPNWEYCQITVQCFGVSLPGVWCQLSRAWECASVNPEVLCLLYEWFIPRHRAVAAVFGYTSEDTAMLQLACMHTALRCSSSCLCCLQQASSDVSCCCSVQLEWNSKIQQFHSDLVRQRSTELLFLVTTKEWKLLSIMSIVTAL